MDRFRKTLSLRKKKSNSQEEDPNIKPVSWQEDERKVRDGCCSFQVKYLGHIEVFDSRGMQVCEEAIKALRRPKKKAIRAILYVSGDTIRVSDEISKGLIVDQTIEKVSFCSPDRNHKKGFAYICRDGTTRRWMCHAFLAVKESGERLSHAVGCAFAICLEKKQKRENEVNTTTSIPEATKPVSKTSSFRQTSLSERLLDPQSAIIAEPPPKIAATSILSQSSPHPPAVNATGQTSTLTNLTSVNNNGFDTSITSATSMAVNNNTCTASPSHSIGHKSVSAVPRPHASAAFFSDRQTSLRMFPKLQESSPFKRDLSLRLADLPNNSSLSFTNIGREELDSLPPSTPPPSASSNILGNTGNFDSSIMSHQQSAGINTNTIKSLCASDTSAGSGDSPSHFPYSHSRYHSTDEGSTIQKHTLTSSNKSPLINPHHQHLNQQMSSSLILTSSSPASSCGGGGTIGGSGGADTDTDFAPSSNNPFLMTGIVNYGVASTFNSTEKLPTLSTNIKQDGSSIQPDNSIFYSSIKSANEQQQQHFSPSNNTKYDTLTSFDSPPFRNLSIFDTDIQQNDDNNNITNSQFNKSPKHIHNSTKTNGFDDTVWDSPFTNGATSKQPNINADELNSSVLSSTNPWNTSTHSPSHTSSTVMATVTNQYTPMKFSTTPSVIGGAPVNSGGIVKPDPFDVSWIGGSSSNPANSQYSTNIQPISPLVCNSTSAAPASSSNTNPFVNS